MAVAPCYQAAARASKEEKSAAQKLKRAEAKAAKKVVADAKKAASAAGGAGGGGAQGENMGAVAEQLSGAGSANDAPTKTLSDVAPKRFLRFRATGAQLVGQNV